MTDQTLQVFLGGSCNPTTWRLTTAIPALTAAGVTFFNPQVKNWTKELEAAEAVAKVSCEAHLWVIDGQTRAVASMIEVAEWGVLDPGRLYLVVLDVPAPRKRWWHSAKYHNERVGEVKDLNRGRVYLRGVAARHNIPTFDTVEGAVQAVIKRFAAK